MSDRIIDFKPPIKGIDQSLPARAQADLTCPDARNMRGMPSLTDTKTAGKRDGHQKAFENAAGAGSGAPVTGLTTAQRASSTSPSTVGREVPVIERWTGYQIETPYQGYYIGTDLKGEYIRFSRKLTDYGANGWQGSSTPPSASIVLVKAGSSFVVNCAEALSSFSDSYAMGFASTFNTTNDIAISLNCYRRARSIDFVDCHNVGPFVRGHPNLGAFVWAYLERTGENTVRLVIESVEGNTTSTLAQGDAFTLSGAAAISNNLRIRLVATASGVEATLTWEDELGTEKVRVAAASSRGATTAQVTFDTLSGVFVAGEVVQQDTTGAEGIIIDMGVDGTTGYFNLWVTSGTFNATANLHNVGSTKTARSRGVQTDDNKRAGWFVKSPATSYPGTEPGYFRRVSGMDFSKIVPPDPQVITEILGTDTMAGAARYYMKPNFEGIDIDSTAGAGNTLYRVVGGQSGYSTAAVQRAPMIDNTLDVLYGPNVSRLLRTGILTVEVWGDGTPPTEFLEVEIIRHRDITAGEEDTGGASFLMENLHV